MINILDEGKQVFDCEIKALTDMRDCLNEDFTIFVNEISDCKGRIVITGMGKSGHIARKIAATMQSLGIKAYFIHPAEGSHGDVGLLTADDLVIAISNSGETDEILYLIPTIQYLQVKLFCIVGRENSTLQKHSAHSIIMPPMKEAFLDTIVPTASTTVTLALGDALAVAVAKKNEFSADNFGIFHPNGLLGKRLTLKVYNLMLKDDENSFVKCGTTIRQAIFEMCRKPIGGVSVIDDSNRLLGIFTDGDLRRLFHKFPETAMDMIIDDVMTKDPMVISGDLLVSDVIQEMNNTGKMVSFFPVTQNGILIGALRLLDITRSGLLG